MHDSVPRAETCHADVRICHRSDFDRDRAGADAFDAADRGADPASHACSRLVGAFGLGAYMFLSIVFWWWWEFQLQHIKTWTFSIYLFVVFYAFYLYLICAMLFPRDLEGYDGYKDYFLARRGWFFGLLIGWSVIDTIDTWIKGADYFASLGATAMIFNVVLALSSVVGMISRRGTVQAVIAVGQLAYLVSGVLRLFNMVNLAVQPS
jgi:hypothetical protein